MKERRRLPRMETPRHVVAIEQHATKGYGDLCDISTSGVRIQTHVRLHPGIISLLFKLPPAKEALKADGIITRVDRKDGMMEIGVELFRPERRILNVIQRFKERYWNVR